HPLSPLFPYTTLFRSAAVALAVIALLPIGPSAHLTAQTEGSILTVLPGSTRSAGLGGAGAALVGDAGAMFANPAGIATVRHLSIDRKSTRLNSSHVKI